MKYVDVILKTVIIILLIVIIIELSALNDAAELTNRLIFPTSR